MAKTRGVQGDAAWQKMTVRMPPAMASAVRVAAEEGGEDVAGLVRRAVQRELIRRAGASASPQIAEDVGRVLDRKLAPIRELVWTAAWQGGMANARARDLESEMLRERVEDPTERARRMTRLDRATAQRVSERLFGGPEQGKAVGIRTPPMPGPGADLADLVRRIQER